MPPSPWKNFWKGKRRIVEDKNPEDIGEEGKGTAGTDERLRFLFVCNSIPKNNIM